MTSSRLQFKKRKASSEANENPYVKDDNEWQEHLYDTCRDEGLLDDGYYLPNRWKEKQTYDAWADAMRDGISVLEWMII